MNRLNTFQSFAVALAAQAWPDDRPSPALADSLISLLCEEVGELARATRKLHRGRRLGHQGEAPGTAAEVLDELGDCLFLLARIADLSEVSLEDAAVGVLQKVMRRIKFDD